MQHWLCKSIKARNAVGICLALANSVSTASAEIMRNIAISTLYTTSQTTTEVPEYSHESTLARQVLYNINRVSMARSSMSGFLSKVMVNLSLSLPNAKTRPTCRHSFNKLCSSHSPHGQKSATGRSGDREGHKTWPFCSVFQCGQQKC
jgi:hypothetical protein